MRFRAESDVNLINLFLHNQEDCYPFDPQAVAETINELAATHTKPGESLVVKATGLGRFTIKFMTNYGQYKHFTQQCHTVDEFQRLVGKRVIEILGLVEADQQVVDLCA